MQYQRAALYSRVSTAGQNTSDPWASLPQQTAALRELAQRMGFVVGLVVEEQGSGAKVDRPGWLQVLDAARAGEVDVIMAVAFDRLTRSEQLGDFEALKRELRALEVRLVTAKQGEINLSGSADAEMMSDMQGVWAKGERLKIRERTMSGRKAKAEAGRHTGSTPPYGYTRVFAPDGSKTFPIDEERAAIVRDIFRRFVAGERVAPIARALQEAAAPCPVNFGRVQGEYWHATQIKLMLTQPLYAGYSSWHRGRGNAPIPSLDFAPLVPLDLWQAAQSRINLLDLRSPRGQHGPQPLSGILRCPSCGRGMGFQKRSNETTKVDWYMCRAAYRATLNVDCTQGGGFNTETAERVVLDYIKARLEPHINGEHLAAQAGEKRPVKVVNPLPALERALAKARERQRRAVVRLLDEDNPDLAPELEDQVKVLRGEIVAIERQMAAARKANEPARDERARLEVLRPLLALLDEATSTRELRREFFDAALCQVELRKTSSRGARPQVLEVVRCQLITEAWI